VAKRNNENSIHDNGEENTCKIKVQISDKKSLLITLKNNQTFKGLLQNCAAQLNMAESKLKLYFDGELINLYETPESLDLDDEACIDLKILD
jgi:small nuclear ribonucleoprotein (snRNP)-like protein